MIIGQSIARINGVPTPLDPNNPLVVPYISNSRTYTPLRFISYHLGARDSDDIVWRGDVNTAELTFNDPNCKWVNGTIRLLTSSYYQYGFYENCTTSNPMNIPNMNLKDSVLSLTFSEYIKEYSNQNYWCAQIRLDEANNIVSWRARPDLFPNCCEPVAFGKARIIGYVNGSLNNPGTTITVYNSSNAVVWTGQTTTNGYYETSTQGNCNLPCPGTYKIVASRQGCTFFEATRTVTFTEKQCCGDNDYQRVDFWAKCPGVETSRIIGYVYGSGTNPGTTIQVFDSSNRQVWSGQTDLNGYYETSTLGVDGILECPGTYRVTATKAGITFSISSQTVSFALGESVQEGKFKRINFTSTYTANTTGRILGFIYGPSGNLGVTVTITDHTGAQVWKGETDINGYYETSAYGSNCILLSPGTYKVVPSKAGCTFTSSFETVIFTETDSCQSGNYKRVDFRSNCSPAYKGRIMGFVFGYDANPETIISIMDESGALVWRGKTDVNGYYETSSYGSLCILKSPGTYKVVPSKAGCTFTSSFETVIFTETDSCEDGNYKRVDFRSNCAADKTARIIGYITGTGGNPGTTVTVYDSSNRQVWIGQTDANGYYETSAAGITGILRCPGTYKIVPTRANCTFTDTSKFVTFASNDSVEDGTYKRIDFTSNCSSTNTARINGYVYGVGSNPGTLITITDANGTKVWSGLTNIRGYYETSVHGTPCILKSPGTYRVVATKNGCSFEQDTKTVTFTEADSCEVGYYARVDFISNCTTQETGRIVGYVFGSGANPGTTITILDNNGVQVWQGVTNSSGYYETSLSGYPCILKSPGIYRVIPSKTGCSFTNSTETVEFFLGSSCEEGDYKRVDFRSNCFNAKTGRIFGYVSGSGSNPNTTITISDEAGIVVWKGQTNSSGYYETSAPGTICILKCPGTYTVVPSKTGCTYTNNSETVILVDADACENGGSKRVDFASNCSPAKKGRISGHVYGSTINPGVLITITDSTGKQVWSGLTNSAGYYETSTLWNDCILDCPGVYTVTPTKSGCTFTNPNETVSFQDGNCCEDGYYLRVNFNSNCSPPETARIAGYVFGAGGSIVTITVYDIYGTQVWTGQTNSNGYYQTSTQNAGILPCPGTYKIVPTKSDCTFTNTYEIVTFYAGDSTEKGWYMRVDFRIFCPSNVVSNPMTRTNNRLFYNTDQMVYLSYELRNNLKRI